MKRKVMVSLILLAILLVSVIPVFAAQPVRVFIDNTQVFFSDVQPIIINGRTMIPLSSVLKKLGLRYQWSEKDQSIYILNKKIMCYKLTVNSLTVEYYEVFDDTSNDIMHMTQFNGPHYYSYLLNPPIVINGRIMVPLRAISEIAGYNISWDDMNSIAAIHTDQNYSESVNVVENNIGGNTAKDVNNKQLSVGDTVYTYAILNRDSYTVYATIVDIDTNNNIQLQWYDIQRYKIIEEIPFLDYFRANPYEFNLLQRTNGIRFDTLQWYSADDVRKY